jgi:hypothetical protein
VLFIADSTALAVPDHPVLVVDLLDDGKRPFPSAGRKTALMTALYKYSARLTVRRPATEAVGLPAPRRTV